LKKRRNHVKKGKRKRRPSENKTLKEESALEEVVWLCKNEIARIEGGGGGGGGLQSKREVHSLGRGKGKLRVTRQKGGVVGFWRCVPGRGNKKRRAAMGKKRRCLCSFQKRWRAIARKSRPQEKCGQAGVPIGGKRIFFIQYKKKTHDGERGGKSNGHRPVEKKNSNLNWRKAIRGTAQKKGKKGMSDEREEETREGRKAHLTPPQS